MKVKPDDRPAILRRRRQLKMARSAHAYVRGNTEILRVARWIPLRGTLPEGPPVWICGDCHLGNLGPARRRRGRVEVQIRDLDQTVIGNPRMIWSALASRSPRAARGSALPGVVTARMIEEMVDGYEGAR